MVTRGFAQGTMASFSVCAPSDPGYAIDSLEESIFSSGFTNRALSYSTQKSSNKIKPDNASCMDKYVSVPPPVSECDPGSKVLSLPTFQ